MGSHEAGHAVFCWRYRYLMSNRHGDGVSIEGGGGGVVNKQSEVFPGDGQLPLEDPLRWLKELRACQEAEIFFAGPQAERRYWRSIGCYTPPIDIAENLDFWEHGLVDRWDPESWMEVLKEQGGGPLDDFASAARVLAEFLTRDEIPPAMKHCKDRVTRLLRHPRTWKAVGEVANQLLGKRHLDSEEVEVLIDGVNPPRWRFRPPTKPVFSVIG